MPVLKRLPRSLQEQHQVVEKFKEETEELRIELVNRVQSVKPNQTFAAAEVLKQLEDQLAVYARKRDAEKKKVQQTQARLRMLQTRVEEERKEVGGGINAFKENDLLLSKQSKLIHQRVDKALMKLNKTISENNFVREQINSYRRDRACFDKIYRNLERQIHEMKKEIAQSFRDTRAALDERDQCHAKLRSLHEQAKLRREHFRTEWDRLGQAVSDEKKKLQRAQEGVEGAVSQESLANPVGILSVEQEDKIKKRVIRSQWEFLNEKSKTKLTSERLQQYENQLKMLRNADGVLDVDSLIDQFLEGEDKIFSLYKYVNNLNSEIARVELRLIERKSELEHLKGQDFNTDAQRKKLLRTLDAKYLAAEVHIIEYQKKYEESMEELNVLKGGIQSIFNRLDATGSPEEMPVQGTTASNLMQCLEIIEQKLTDFSRPEGDDRTIDDIVRSTIVEQEQSPLLGPLQVSAPAAEDLNSGDESEVDDGDRPLNREELQLRAVKNFAKSALAEEAREQHEVLS